MTPLIYIKIGLEIAKKRLASTCTSISLAGIKYLPHVKILFNAFVIQPLLYACEVWGPTLLSSASFHPITNDMQKITKEFYTRIYGLPSGTPHSTVLLEFGLEPIALTIAKRVNKFFSKLSPLLLPPHNADPLSRSLLDGACMAGMWQKVMADRLGLVQFTMHNLPHENDLVGAMQQKLSTMFMSHASDNIHSDQCKTRIISSYIQLLWNGKLGCHHPIYDVMGMPYDVYLDIVRFRTLNVPAAVYTVPRSNRTIPYSQRLCPFKCGEPADLEHIALRCPQTKLSADEQRSVASIFDSRDVDYLQELAFSVHAAMDKLRHMHHDTRQL